MASRDRNLTMFSYFTIASANEALPAVIEKFDKVLQQKNKVREVEKQLQTILSSTGTFEEYVILKQKLNSIVTGFYQSIENLEDTGVVVKSIDEGLLDFPSKRFEDEVWLCWKQGETEIKFWHEKDVGFDGRKPITVADESLV